MSGKKSSSEQRQAVSGAGRLEVECSSENRRTIIAVEPKLVIQTRNNFNPRVGGSAWRLPKHAHIFGPKSKCTKDQESELQNLSTAVQEACGKPRPIVYPTHDKMWSTRTRGCKVVFQ
eukprot:3958667-Amphidinium_carterae.1